MRAGQPSQAQPIQLEDAFEMCEQHFDFLAITPRLLVLRRVGDLTRDIPRALVHATHDSAVGHVRAALLLHWASRAVVLAGAVEDRAGLGDAIARLGELASVTQ